MKLKIIILATLALLLGGTVYAAYSDYFRIETISVSGEGRITPEDVRAIVRSQIDNSMIIFLPQENLLLFDTEKLSSTLHERFSLDFLDVTKILPRELSIEFREKKHSLVWSEGDNFYYADLSGELIFEVDPNEAAQKDYPLIRNESSELAAGGRATVSSDKLQFISDLYYTLKDEPEMFRKLNREDPEEKPEKVFIVSHFLIDNDPDTVKIICKGGPEVYMNTKNDLDKQVQKLLVIKSEVLKDEFFEKSYINLRIGDSVYYR